jgi:hypothetical protein
VNDQAVLPELEHLLVRAARRRTAPRRLRQRRWILAAAAIGALLLAAAAAATSVILASGETDGGTFTIEARQVPPPNGNGPDSSICLQLTFSGRGSAYGCGIQPSPSRPFGLVVADPLDGRDDRVVYGLVSDAVKQVRVLGGGGGYVEAATEANKDLWGRFFYAIAPNEEHLKLVGYGGDGQIVGTLGNVAPAPAPPRSKMEARKQGDPAGFAPAIAPPEIFLYRGREITSAVVRRNGLACMQGRTGFHCFDTEAEIEADGEAGR